MLPESKKVKRDTTAGLSIYIYGPPMVGKTWFANKFPKALLLNTDGNIKYVDSPNKDFNTWEEFKDTVNEIVKGDHDFRTIVVDLLEDVYDMCRVHYYEELGIIHESDLGYAKGYDIIRTDFLGTIKKLCRTPYNVVLISHESERTTKNRIGKEVTNYSPNLSDKVANKVAGMVSLVSRVVKEVREDETEIRMLKIIPNSNEFGGGRPPSATKEKIELEYEEFKKLFDTSLKSEEDEIVPGLAEEDVPQRKSKEEDETTKRRSRKSRRESMK